MKKNKARGWAGGVPCSLNGGPARIPTWDCAWAEQESHPRPHACCACCAQSPCLLTACRQVFLLDHLTYPGPGQDDYGVGYKGELVITSLETKTRKDGSFDIVISPDKVSGTRGIAPAPACAQALGAALWRALGLCTSHPLTGLQAWCL